MALTSQVRISDIGDGNYSVSATITDDTRPADKQTETVSVLSTRFDTPQQKTDAWANLKTQYVAKIAKIDAIAAIEVEAKDYLEKP